MPVWLTGPVGVANKEYETLTSSLTADVAVIGAGITGLSVAYELLERGRQVVLLDDGHIGSGETGRTTAMLNNVPDDHLFSIRSMYGTAAAKLVYESMNAALQRMKEIADKEGFECDWEWIDALLIVGCDTSHPDYNKEVDALHKELDACHEAGFSTVRLQQTPKELVPGIDAGECLVYPQQAQFHIIKYINGLAEAVVRRGGKIYTNTHIQDITTTEKQTELVTLTGHTIHAEAVVQATNIPITNRVSVIDRMENLRTYLIAAELPAGFPSLQIDDLEEPYHYIRTVKGGKDGKNMYLLVGGEDHVVGVEDKELQDKKFTSLEDWMRERWPAAGTVVYQWSGQIAEPIDQLPLTGNNPHDASNVYIHTADSGNGITNGAMAGIILADLIAGRDNRWAQLYSPKRKPIKAAGRYIKHGIEMGTRYRRWLKGGDVKDIEDIQPCTGAVVLKGMKYVAAYKGEDGQVEAMTAVCPHLQAIIKWNDSEQVTTAPFIVTHDTTNTTTRILLYLLLSSTPSTLSPLFSPFVLSWRLCCCVACQSWDCPAHGSRWNKHGEIVSGPAKSNLQKVDLSA